MSAVMSDVMSDSNSHCRLFDSVPRGNGATNRVDALRLVSRRLRRRGVAV